MLKCSKLNLGVVILAVAVVPSFVEGFFAGVIVGSGLTSVYLPPALVGLLAGGGVVAVKAGVTIGIIKTRAVDFAKPFVAQKLQELQQGIGRRRRSLIEDENSVNV